ncbi:MAG: hypothetical protein J6D37_00800 [Clostridia bacterium]|nr:hypothetical protein [Clostridia bacterium]
MKLKQNLFGYLALGSAVCALVGLIIYIVSSTTGYMEGREMDALPVLLTIVAIVCLVAAPLLAEKLGRSLAGALLFVGEVLLAVSLCMFINARVDHFADIVFIPVNYPLGEKTTLIVSIVGFVFYILAILASIVAAFGEKLIKD